MGTVHEGRCSAEDFDSDFNVNDSMEDCGDDFNGGSAWKMGNCPRRMILQKMCSNFVLKFIIFNESLIKFTAF